MHTAFHPHDMLATHRIEAAAEQERAHRGRLLRALRREHRRAPWTFRDSVRGNAPITGRPALAP